MLWRRLLLSETVFLNSWAWKRGSPDNSVLSASAPSSEAGATQKWAAKSFFQIQSEQKLKRKKKMNLLKVIPELKLSEKSKPSESDLDSAVPSVWTCIQLIQKRKGMFNTLHTFRRFQSIQKRRLTAERYCKKQISADLKSKNEISERGFQTKGKWSFPKNSMWGKDENSILYIFSGSNWAFWLTAYIDMDSNGAIEFIMTSCTTPAFSNIPSCPEGWDIYSICN